MRFFARCPYCGDVQHGDAPILYLMFLERELFCSACGHRLEFLHTFVCKVPEDERGNNEYCENCEFRFRCFTDKLDKDVYV